MPRLLAHTSPTPEPDIDVQPWLHGVESGPADVFVCWRADLDNANREHWPEIVSLFPPRRGELLALPYPAFLRWLARHDYDTAMADAEGTPARSMVREEVKQPVLRWDGDESAVVSARRMRPGDTIVVPANLGGTDQFGFNPHALPAQDVAESALAESLSGRKGAEFAFRLHPKLTLPGTFPQNWPSDVLARIEEGETITAAEIAPLLAPSFEAQSHAGLDAILTMLREENPDIELRPYPASDPEGFIVTLQVAVSLATSDLSDIAELDVMGWPRRAVTIADHSKQVAQRAQIYAERCGLPKTVQRAIELAGDAHDLGKYAPISNYNCVEVLPIVSRGWHLLKRLQGFASVRSLYPGWRHEALSGALLSKLDPADFPGVDLDLVRYLAGTSHGRGRPFFLAAPGPHGVVEAPWNGRLLQAEARHGLDSLDSGWCELWHSLADRYGLWGLAWLESILRLADHRVSSEETT